MPTDLELTFSLNPFHRLLRHIGKLQICQASVKPIRSGEFCVRAALNHLAFVQHNDLVGTTHRGQSMGNHDHRAAHHQPFQRVLHQMLALGIKGAGSLIKQQDGRILQHGTSNGDPLALTA